MSSTHRGAERNPRDFYATPESAFKPVLQYLPRKPRYWEPAQGDGRLVRMLQSSGRRAAGADLATGTDFLKDNRRREFILTNPPFSLAFEFLEHSLELAPEVMLLLRLNFLGSSKRRDFFRLNEPNAIFVITPRPSFSRGGNDSCEYGWFYWGRRYQGIKHP